MADATVAVAASEKEAASVAADIVTVVDIDAVAGADMETVLPARSDKAPPIQNDRGYRRRLL